MDNRFIAVASAAVFVIIASISLVGCAGLEMWGEKFSRDWQGVPATMRTYAADGQQVDEVKGESFRVSRDDRFDTSDGEGSSNKDSQVLLMSIGDSTISHVGSTMILAEEGLTVVDQEPQVSIENTEPGRPWLNSMRERAQNKWRGKGKTILIRSQDSVPLAVYAGNEVEMVKTDVPKSTWFRVDGKYLFVYRADYTVYDNDLLDK